MKKIIIPILLMAFVGCKKMIDGPDNSTLPTSFILETNRDLDNLLYGAYGAIGNGNTLTGNWRIFPELLADAVVINVNDNNPADPYLQVYNRNLTQAQYSENWRLGYTAIQNANTVIYAIESKLITKEKDPEFSDDLRDKMLGEAYFIRGLCYFELVRFYGQPYKFSTPPSASVPGTPSPDNSLPNSGVILRVKPILNITSKDDIIGQGRGTVEETYQLVISDLKKAELLLPPVSTPRRGRATNYAAGAILARVYFQQNNFPAALEEINKVLGPIPGAISTEFILVRANTATVAPTAAQAESNALAAFKTTGATSIKVSENIFDLVSSTTYTVNAVVNRKYVRTATIEPHLAISNAFLAAANFHVNDGRKTGMITTVGTKNYTKKYDQAIMNVPIIRSSELVLDRAEIYAMIASTLPNGSAEHLAALEDLKSIRSRSIANAAAAFPTTTTITAASILAEVRIERIRELAFEGDRLHNLRRLQATIDAGDRIGVSPFAFNSSKLLFKIPDDEIRTSTNIVQNPD